MIKKAAAFSVILALILTFTCACGKAEIVKENTILCTVFPQYDFARRIAGDKMTVSMLIPCGAEAHDYEPSAKDIKAIAAAKLFIYIGGESDAWVDRILGSSDYDVNAVSLIDSVYPVYVEGEEGDEVDEHIWTSPKNALIMANKISEEICKADPENAEYYRDNTEKLRTDLRELDAVYTDLAERLKGKVLIIGDRDPFAYLSYDYGIRFSAAFNGCGHDNEPSAATLSSLINIAAAQKATKIFYIDFSNGKIARTVAEGIGGAETVRLHSCHNVTSQEFETETYCSLMKENAESMLGE